MYKNVVITNRHLCEQRLCSQVEALCQQKVDSIILREKDLSAGEYLNLATEILAVGKNYQVEIVLHSFVEVAKQLGVPRIHLPLPLARRLNVVDREYFQVLGISTHSLEEVREAEALGATYITYGPVFQTQCKPGVEGKGTAILQWLVQATALPVYALGGINNLNKAQVAESGVAGICQMSEAMKKI